MSKRLTARQKFGHNQVLRASRVEAGVYEIQYEGETYTLYRGDDNWWIPEVDIIDEQKQGAIIQLQTYLGIN